MKEKNNKKLYWDKTNSIIFAAGILSIIMGYIFLARESRTLAPILLVLGYAVLIPISLIYKGWGKKEEK
ncbi:hypothetical protein JW879_02945 [candidate division WOR-3 bacterium]|nr:hypothetical protein [candidate division WOR-3 bacterium]